MAFIKSEADEMCEDYEFDKFMEDILGKEKQRPKRLTEEIVSQGRAYIRRYAGTLNERIKYGRG